MYDYQFTNRMERIFELARKVARGVIYPHHLLIGASHEGTGVCGELYLYLTKQFGVHFAEELLRSVEQGDSEYFFYNDQKFSGASIEVLERANVLMKKYNQMFIHEGHILQAVLERADYLNEEVKEDIMRIACVARDLIVDLSEVDDELKEKNAIRRLTEDDLEAIKRFIVEEFDARWLGNFENLHGEELPVFLALQDEEIVGFACYDTFEGKKGYFGPMGVAKHHRLASVGKELLQRSLVDMSKKGYAYAILGGAGPIEFYEKNCNAKVIPLFGG
ncbi:GNAT family N-acetyltransferase [Salirhabdus sp. Marseille-P4669]|uniref:GNAT family N-acetyltransferase n=1 Tax=Salirhabdus sp. Marseille-P4669 TaxID=2042310 RepID=UPI000C7E012D|nr:GNAT family N-acetyltransferase [Salirhabdus sp. Marseille-P4669]